MDPKVIQYFVLNNTSYFAIAEEYVTLQETFIKDTFIEKLFLWFDMFIYPAYLVITTILYNQVLSIMTIASIHKTVTIWLQYLKYRTLSRKIHEWTNIVRSVGGPFISTNDPTYHVYVYADGMQRLHDSLFGTRHTHSILAKKGTKRL
jgi:hypothetical protein